MPPHLFKSCLKSVYDNLLSLPKRDDDLYMDALGASFSNLITWIGDVEVKSFGTLIPYHLLTLAALVEATV